LFKRVALALSLLYIIGLSGLYAQEKGVTQTKKEEFKFSFKDTHNQKIDLIPTRSGLKFPTLKGKKVLIMFFINSGTPCKNELKMFSRVKDKYPDLEFIAFELKGLKQDGLREFEKRMNLKGIHLIDTAQAMPFAQFIAKVAQWRGSVPLIILVDKNGDVKHMQLGALSEQDLANWYKKI